MTINKLEENFIDLKDHIKNYHNSKDLEMRIYWLKKIWEISQYITNEIKEILKLFGE